METVRLVLFVILAFLLLQIWESWQQENQPEPMAQAVANPDIPAPVDIEEDVDSMPGGQSVATPAELPAAGSYDTLSQQASRLVRVETDTLIVEIDSRGAVPRRAWLKQYPVTQENPEELTVILDDSAARQYYVQSGMVASPESLEAPNHNTLFTIESDNYQLTDGKDQLEIVATARLENGITAVRRLGFKRGSYQVKIETTLSNQSERAWQGRFYNQLVRSPGSGAERSFFAPASYEGSAYYTADQKYNKVSYDDIDDQPMALPTDNGWVAMLEHYFVTALVPEQTERFYTRALEAQRYAVGTLSPGHTVQTGQELSDAVTLYLGPKEQHRLTAISQGLELATDFGMLTFLAQPVFWVLKWLHGLFGNWGWAIIGVTVILKAFFYPLSTVGYRSMAKMKGVQPKMVALREAYADDKTVLNQKMMELYRTEKINPLGGCLPILIQIPVFIALYWVLLESVELRQAGFVLWLTDLSQADPYYVLPIIMGVSMLVQQRMNPTQLDPIQQKVMMAMPIVFTFFFLTFPAGLVLYWVVNNILSILQQWYITRQYTAS